MLHVYTKVLSKVGRLSACDVPRDAHDFHCKLLPSTAVTVQRKCVRGGRDMYAEVVIYLQKMGAVHTKYAECVNSFAEFTWLYMCASGYSFFHSSSRRG